MAARQSLTLAAAVALVAASKATTTITPYLLMLHGFAVSATLQNTERTTRQKRSPTGEEPMGLETTGGTAYSACVENARPQYCITQIYASLARKEGQNMPKLKDE